MFEPNPKAVVDAANNMLAIRKGGYRNSIDDACFFAWEVAFSYDRDSTQHIFWRAVYNELYSRRKERK